jgi:hypothetical protein
MTHIPDHHIEQALRFGYDPEQEAQLVHDNSAIPMVKRDTLEGVCVGLMWATNVHDDPECGMHGTTNTSLHARNRE